VPDARTSLYHRLLGEHARPLRRVAVVAVAGVAVGVVVGRFSMWQLAVLAGWVTAAVVFLTVVWAVILRYDGAGTRRNATIEDETRETARILLLAASATSLVSVAFSLALARHIRGGDRIALVALAGATVLLSWAVMNTVFTLRYAHLYYLQGATGGIDYGGAPGDLPDYRDFAYVAFTIGMTYQVSDTTLRDRRIRREVLIHALLSYVYGVVIVAASVNIVAGLAS
jgi:uncharacterized membrane protein